MTSYDPVTFKTGLAIALISKGRRFPKREPAAFLYNGVRLPGLPVVEYPVKVIHYDPNNKDYFLAAFERENYFESYGQTLFGNKDGVPKVAMFFTKGEEWESFEQDWNFVVDKQGKYYEMCPVVWTNFDLKHSDGTLYSAKSEPVPVYE